MTTPQSRTLNLGDGRPSIEVLEAGEGAPLLFLHGAGGIVAWEGVLPLLSSKYHVYAPLAPGFGASTGLECLEDQFDLFMHGFDVIETLGLERPYVVGESFGGWMAAEMAALRPKEIGRLALFAPVGLWRDEAPVVDEQPEARRTAANRSRSMPFGITRVRSGSAPSAIWRARFPS